MRKVMIWTVGLTLLAMAVGCQRCNLFRRGALFAPTAAVPAAVIECPPVDPCADTVIGGACDPCTPPMTTVTPPPATFAPGPTG
jgi:hypothetical protein